MNFELDGRHRPVIVIGGGQAGGVRAGGDGGAGRRGAGGDARLPVLREVFGEVARFADGPPGFARQSTGLRDGPLRFSELHTKIEGISEKMLAKTLRTLVGDGLIVRTVHPSTPPMVSYGLSKLGEGITQLLHGLMSWIGEHAADVHTARTAHREGTDPARLSGG
ncbi:winged helix-turn-helix transcriptional regulator [Amycolatopsis sp. NPDC058278]|uniref:winged helix-turn-helix transcriptional regulator n=1 Tax=Amycolatopsis sp. NPDC058278 TaxID=3346417 RepID=UPI0036DAF85F